jgi:hypothetical protein
MFEFGEVFVFEVSVHVNNEKREGRGRNRHTLPRMR